jgi:hypothetical protein
MKCDECSNNGTWEIDPFREEIHGEIVWMILCEDCYQSRADDI